MGDTLRLVIHVRAAQEIVGHVVDHLLPAQAVQRISSSLMALASAPRTTTNR